MSNEMFSNPFELIEEFNEGEISLDTGIIRGALASRTYAHEKTHEILNSSTLYGNLVSYLAYIGKHHSEKLYNTAIVLYKNCEQVQEYTAMFSEFLNEFSKDGFNYDKFLSELKQRNTYRKYQLKRYGYEELSLITLNNRKIDTMVVNLAEIAMNIDLTSISDINWLDPNSLANLNSRVEKGLYYPNGRFTQLVSTYLSILKNKETENISIDMILEESNIKYFKFNIESVSMMLESLIIQIEQYDSRVGSLFRDLYSDLKNNYQDNNKHNNSYNIIPILERRGEKHSEESIIQFYEPTENYNNMDTATISVDEEEATEKLWHHCNAFLFNTENADKKTILFKDRSELRNFIENYNHLLIVTIDDYDFVVREHEIFKNRNVYFRSDEPYEYFKETIEKYLPGDRKICTQVFKTTYSEDYDTLVFLFVSNSEQNITFFSYQYQFVLKDVPGDIDSGFFIDASNNDYYHDIYGTLLFSTILRTYAPEKDEINYYHYL